MAIDRTTIGQMRERVAILTVSAHPFGEFSISDDYTYKYTLRARVRKINGVDARNGIGIHDGETTHVVIVRNGAAISIDKSCMLVWRTGFYRILSVNTLSRYSGDPKDRFLQLEVAYDSKVTLEILTALTNEILTSLDGEVLTDLVGDVLTSATLTDKVLEVLRDDNGNILFSFLTSLKTMSPETDE